MAARAMAVAACSLELGTFGSAVVCSGSRDPAVSIRALASFHSVRSKRVLSGNLRRTQRIEAAFGFLKVRSSFDHKCKSLVTFAARGEIPEEIIEDSKFVPLNEDDPRYGPAVLFLLGFGNNEAVRVQEMLREMEGDFLRVVLCTPEMIKGTLGQAVNTQQLDVTTVDVAKNLPAICFLSGLTGEEIMLLIQAFRDFGFEGTVFAAHVPNNTDKTLEELIEEIMGDHERLTKSRQPTQA